VPVVQAATEEPELVVVRLAPGVKVQVPPLVVIEEAGNLTVRELPLL
jgi:hypothetical protein